MNQAPHTRQAALKAVVKKQRDARLDFFRGASLAIIFIAHMLGNPWNGWIPARFGFSDAADTFVFCSGFASGLAFHRVFQTHGFRIGAIRIGFRIWQVYWAFVLLSLAMIGVALTAEALIPTAALVKQFYLDYFIKNFDALMFPLLQVRYHPALADVLPMYLVMLAAIPAVVMLARVNRFLPIALCLCLYLWANATGANFSRVNGPYTGVWFFNPLAWQIYFFAGFLISSGIAPAPPRHWALTAFAVAFVIASLPVSNVGVRFLGDWARELRLDLLPSDHKSNLSILRVVHFFCTAYLVGVSWRGLNDRLQSGWTRPVVLMGQYSLAIFMVGVLLSLIGTAIAGYWRGGWPMWIVLNLGGIAGLYLTALIARETKRLAARSDPLPA